MNSQSSKFGRPSFPSTSNTLMKNFINISAFVRLSLVGYHLIFPVLSRLDLDFVLDVAAEEHVVCFDFVR